MAEAEPFYKRVFAIAEKALGPEHPDIAASLNNLAQTYQATGRLAEAEPHYRRAIAISEKPATEPSAPDVGPREPRRSPRPARPQRGDL